MKIVVAMFMAVTLVTSYAQEGENFSCKCCSSTLQSLLEGKSVKEIYIHGCTGTGSSGMATSFLMPTGTPPKIDTSDGAADYSPLEAFTCRYAPGLVSDGDPKTAWVEGSKDYGINEMIIVSCLDLKESVQIWSGYGKSPTIFTQNSRPKKVRALIIRGENPAASQYGTWYYNLTVVKQVDIDLKDLNEFQPLPVPAFDVLTYIDSNQSKMEYNYFLGIVILDVYKGTKYSDTCISEVRNTPKP